MTRVNQFSINYKKKTKIKNTNTQTLITYSNQIFNTININSIVNDKNSKCPIKIIHISRTFKCPISLGKDIFIYFFFKKYNCNLYLSL